MTADQMHLRWYLFRTTRIVCLLMGFVGFGGFHKEAAASLLANYAFNTVNGTAPTQTTPDSSGNNLTGSLLGGTGVTPGTNYPWLVNNSPDGTSSMQFFGGTSSSAYSRVEVADASSGPLDNTFTNFTFSAWLMPDALTTRDRYLAGKIGGSGQRGWQMDRPANTSDLNIDYFNTASGTDQLLTVPNVFIDNHWIGLAVVFTGGTSVDVYVNQGGVTTLALHQTSGVLATWNGSNSAPFQIGDRGVFASAAWTGYIDNVQIYDESLSAAQVAALMPTPEPSTLALGVMGLIAVAIWKRKSG